MLDKGDIQAQILRVIEEFSTNREGATTPVLIDNDQVLTEDLGLESLELAQIVVELEFEFDVDPFTDLVAVTDIRTVGDLCDAYVSALVMKNTGTNEQTSV